jgi:hypothetical protein
VHLICYTKYINKLRALFLRDLHFSNTPTLFGGVNAPSSGSTHLFTGTSLLKDVPSTDTLSLLAQFARFIIVFVVDFVNQPSTVMC